MISIRGVGRQGLLASPVQFGYGLALAGVWLGVLALAAEGQDVAVLEARSVDQQGQSATTVDEWMAQIEAALVQITGVRLAATEAGLQVVLETADDRELAVPTTTVSGNALIAEIPNAVLALPAGDEFQQFEPAEGIALLQVTEVPGDRVQVAVTGVDAAPMAEVSATATGLTLSIVPGFAQLGEADESIQIVVTGEQDEGYNPSSTSVGTRNDTPLIDIPASIQVIPEAVIEDQRAFDLLDVLRNTPGIVTNTSPRDLFSGFTIRGFDTGNTFLRNGVPDNDAGRTGLDLTNVERIEVLRGPASVLFGQIAPGGAINIVTKRPLPFPFYDVEVTYGSFNTYQGAVDLSGPLTEDGSVSYRFNAAIFGSDTFVDEIDIDRYLIAPVITWNISDSTDITFEAEYLDAQYPNERGLPIEGTILPNPNGELPRNRYLGEPSFDRNDRMTLRVGYDLEHRFNENWRLRNTFRFSWEEDYQDSVGPSPLQADLRTQPRRAFITSSEAGYSFAQNNYETTLAAIGNFEAFGADHELTIGADFSHEVGLSPFYLQREIGSIDIFNPVYNQPLGPITDVFDPSRDTATSVGVYLQDQINFSEQFIVLLGGRFDYVNQASLDFLSNTGSSQSDTAFSPRVGLVYKPAENVALYGSFSQSFEQVTGRSLEGTLFQPSRGTQYEIGIKADWLDNRLSTTLALYHLTLSNVLTSDPRNTNFSIQTGEQFSQGVELNVVGEILLGWNVIAGYAYTDARITQDNDFPVGNNLANVPNHAINLWTTYTIQEGDLSGLGFGLGLYYVGSRPGDLDNTFTLPDYLRTDAAIYYRRENFQAQLNFKNLFNTYYFESANGRNRIFPGAPFEMSATLGWEF
ncbi:MAG: TonB-dependent siderophore receptor [Cyanobacteria bacterium P01_A01_bin.123]